MVIFNWWQGLAKLRSLSGRRCFFKVSQTLHKNDANQDTQIPNNHKPAVSSQINPDLVKNRDIYVIDKKSGQLYQQVCAIAGASRSIVSLQHVNDAVILTLQNVTASSIFIFNIDTFQYLADAVDRLLALRPLFDDAVFIICSTKFESNNFSSERKAIADASLRLPCNIISLRDAVENGLKNHANR